MIRFRIALKAGALVCALFLAFNQPAAADELQDITVLYKKGESAKALERLETYLSAKPKDIQGAKIAQARFLKGLILAEQGKIPEAIKVYTSLTEEYPELPEPYNNLAVLYATQNQMEKARQALEMAISTHPSYATAHENLGDIYAKMASLAYDKALQLDKGNAAAQTKLALVKEMFSSSGKPTRPPVKSEPAKNEPINSEPVKSDIAKLPPPVSASAVAATPAKPVEAEPAKPAPATKPAEAKQAAEPKPATQPKPAAEPKSVSAAKEKSSDAPKSAGAGGKQDGEAAIKTLHAWAKAWSDRNVGAYLAFYAKDFKTPGGENRAAWEKTRKERISRPKSIHVTIEGARVTLNDGDNATVVFRQIYKSNALTTSTQKTVVLAKNGGKWLIQQERVGR